MRSGHLGRANRVEAIVKDCSVGVNRLHVI